MVPYFNVYAGSSRCPWQVLGLCSIYAGKVYYKTWCQETSHAGISGLVADKDEECRLYVNTVSLRYIVADNFLGTVETVGG